VAVSSPRGDTMPMPVTTTLRACTGYFLAFSACLSM
jgi:hypothetical protein